VTTDRLQSGRERLAARITARAARTVIYTRGDETVELSATAGTSDFDVADDSGILSRYYTRDFIVTASDLILGGAVTTPRRGDTVTETSADGAQAYTYQVVSPAGTDCWRYVGAGREQIRVHTQQAGKELA